MSEQDGPDLAAGIPLTDIGVDVVLGGKVGDDDVFLAWVESSRGTDAELVAYDAACTHLQASLPDGIRVGDTVRCPFHHACFSLRTGEAVWAPAFAPLRRWAVEIADGRVRVLPGSAVAAVPGQAGAEQVEPEQVENSRGVERVVIVGGGAAGYATAERLRRVGYRGAVTLVSAERYLPIDRTKLSKGYLAGQAGPEGLPLSEPDWYEANAIDTRLGATADGIDLAAHEVSLAGGERLPFDALVLATGATPVRPELPGFDRPDVHLLRSVSDADAIIKAAGPAGRVVVLGSGFIGLETAAALRQRGVEVTVVSRSPVPLAAVLGSELGALVRSVHEEKGVRFVTGEAASWDGSALSLADGATVEGAALVVGLGVEPVTALAEAAGLEVDNGIVVDARGETAHAGVFAAGDAARFPDPRTGEPIRVEHWAVAGRAGALAAINLLGGDEALAEPPFFWSRHFDLNIRFAGYAGQVGDGGASADVEGSLADRDATVRYTVDGRLAAVATVGRDRESLSLEDGLREASGR